MADIESFSEIPLLDNEQLDMLTESGNPESAELMFDLLGLFEEESTQKISELKSGLESQDCYIIERAAHSIAGSSANIGGMRLWKVAKALEAKGKEKAPVDGLALYVNVLEETYTETLVALKELVNKLQQGS